MTARRRRRDERGLAAVMFALTASSLILASAFVMDIGLVRVDRQADKTAADAAVLAGLNGLGTSETDAYSYKGVCTALRVLQSNGPRFSGVTDTTGTWTDGAGAATGNGCTSASYRAQKCVAGNLGTWAKFSWSGTYQGSPLKVTIQSGYSLSGTGMPEDTLAAAVADSSDTAQGCFQLAVTITQNRKPGFGSLARSSDLVSTVRSVGRVNNRPNGDAPAMLLLKRTGCPVLNTGSNGGTSYIHVYGSVSPSGSTQPGSIHADTDGSGCSGDQVFEGKSAAGIVAYAAPSASNPSQPDPALPGVITSYAARLGVGVSTLRDGLGLVYGSAALNESTAGSASKTEPSARKLVTRSLVDERYLGYDRTPATDGVKKAVADAQTNVFSRVTSAAAALVDGYKVISSCDPSDIDLLGVTSADKVYVDCTTNAGFTGTRPILAGTVVFAGSIKPPNSASGVSLPNAHHVYVFGAAASDALALSNGSVLNVNTSGNLSAGSCSNAQSPSKAIMFIKAGDIKQTGGTLRLCYTTVISMGNQPDGCLPSYAWGTTPPPPSQTPCAGGVKGDGQLSQTGGDIDWTAPNRYDLMSLPSGEPDPTKSPAWRDVNGPEDLAFWSESGGNSSSSTYNMNGGGLMHTVGVFMVPNADQFTIGGGAHQYLRNAQYVVSSIYLNGSYTSISMSVDANSAIQLPRLQSVGLVR